MLREAIERNVGLVLSMPSAGALRHMKSRFLRDAGSEGIWIEAPIAEMALLKELLASQCRCTVSFKHETSKVMFATPLLRLEENLRINAETTMPALLIEQPNDLKIVQRRSNYRVHVGADGDVAARVWRMSPVAELKDQPPSTAELLCQVRDLSLGGMGVNFTAKDGGTPKVSTEDRLRVQLTYGEHTVLLEARMKHSSSPNPKLVRAGLEFVPQKESIEHRRAVTDLAKIVGELQRLEIRKYRMGLLKQAG